MREPLLRPALALCFGIALHRWAEVDASWATAGFVGLFVVALWKARTLAWTCGLLAVAGAGVIVSDLHKPSAPPHLNAEAGETVLLEGCVVEPPLFHDGREQFTLEIAPEARVRVSLLLDSESQSPAWQYGQKVELPARIRHPRNFGNPGAFDYVGYLARKHIYWTATAKPGPDLRVVAGECGSKTLAALFRIRAWALERTAALFGSNRYHRALLDALLIGEASRLERTWTEDYRRTGTYHALVISGLHITVIAASLMFLCKLLFLPRETGLTCTSLVAWLYALASGATPPALRAAALFTLFSMASLLYRRGNLLNLLSATAIAFLIFDPQQLFDPGFQMSFVAVAAIGALAQPVLEATSDHWRSGVKQLASSKPDHRVPPDIAEVRVELRYFVEAVGWPKLIYIIEGILRVSRVVWSTTAVTVLVQAGLLVPAILYFHRVSITSVAANLIAVPLLTIAVPVGFGALFTGWGPLVATTSGLVDTARRLVEWQASFEPSWRIPDPPVLFAAAAILVLALAACRRRIGMTVVAILVSIGLVAAALREDPTKGELRLQVLDVGQGDSLLITLPDGRRMLVDGGGIPTFGKSRKPSMDIGEDVVSAYMWRMGIRSVDVIAVTHAHEDHVGGVRSLIENFHPREIWAGANADESDAWRRLLDAGERSGVKVKRLSAGKPWTSGRVHIEVLSPAPDYTPGPTPRNDDSLVLQLTFGRHRLLLTGDMERASEVTLSGKLSKIDVLKVAHHGSRTSTSADFLAQTQPAIALISVGEGNLYRHPHPDVLGRLERANVGVYRTDLMGMIDVRSDGRYLQVHPFRPSFR